MDGNTQNTKYLHRNIKEFIISNIFIYQLPQHNVKNVLL